MSKSFDGFPSEGLQFLADLEINNERPWFQARKQLYLDKIIAPTISFVKAMGERLQTISPHINYDTRTNGSGSMMRIYRDVRFSKDKRPYKTHVGIIFWEGSGKKTECPAFYFGLDADGAGAHVGLYGFPKPMLTAYREAVADDKQGSELEAVIAQVQTAGDYQIGAPHYKRVPRGYDKDHPREALLRHNTLMVSAARMETAVTTSPALLDVCFEHFKNMASLQQWLVKISQ